jgi:PST family polysaccharide transporter
VWYFQGTEKLAFVATLNFIVKVLIAVLTIFLIKENSDYWKYNFLQSISLILVGLISVYLLYSKYSFVLQKFDLKLVFKVLKLGFPVFLGSILVTFITSLFFIFLKVYSSENELSIFSTSNKIIATLQGLILLPFSQAFFPIIARDAVNDFERFKKNINKVFYLLFACTFLIGVIVYFFGDLIIQVIFGVNYVVAFESLKILAFLPMFSAFTNIFAYQGLLSLKKDKLFLIIHIVFAALSVLFSFILLKNYTALTASWIRIIIEILLFLTAYFFYKRSIKIKNATS